MVPGRYNATLTRALSIVLILGLLSSTLPQNPFNPQIALATNIDPANTGLPKGYVTATITSFSPTNGKPGVEVAVIGTNFLTAYPQDNAVDFNGVPAEVVEVTATKIRVKVPPGAATGPISVRTPGGRAVSQRQFIATFSRAVDVKLPAGLNPQSYTLVNKYGSATINSVATVPANPKGVTLHSAVPNELLSKRLFFKVVLLCGCPSG